MWVRACIHFYASVSSQYNNMVSFLLDSIVNACVLIIYSLSSAVCMINTVPYNMIDIKFRVFTKIYANI